MFKTKYIIISLIKNTCWLTLICITNSALAINPVNIVYRIDQRNPDEIAQAGGMFPRFDSIQSPDLLDHFSGEAPYGYTSGFIATTTSLEQAVEHARFSFDREADGAYQEDFETYLYAIRPTENFYSVDGSIIHAIDTSSQNVAQYSMLSDYLQEWGGMAEWVAYGGFTDSRILSYAVLTGTMLNCYPETELHSAGFWDSHWVPYPTYLTEFDQDHSSSEPYLAIGPPQGFVIMAQSESGQQLPLAQLAGAVCNNSQNINNVAMRKKRTVEGICNNKKFITSRYFYDKKALASALTSLDL
ncbi:enterotoxin A family protein [Yersinia artesiana]|uniref:enterotoxin A family protein n=1 Tax=Yersinia artesiana TaxID=2890315 RepID=UPI001581B1F8|nr:enterotoxin A family protein [Yersinia artesiana]